MSQEFNQIVEKIEISSTCEEFLKVVLECEKMGLSSNLIYYIENHKDSIVRDQFAFAFFEYKGDILQDFLASESRVRIIKISHLELLANLPVKKYGLKLEAGPVLSSFIVNGSLSVVEELFKRFELSVYCYYGMADLLFLKYSQKRIVKFLDIVWLNEKILEKVLYSAIKNDLLILFSFCFKKVSDLGLLSLRWEEVFYLSAGLRKYLDPLLIEKKAQVVSLWGEVAEDELRESYLPIFRIQDFNKKNRKVISKIANQMKRELDRQSICKFIDFVNGVWFLLKRYDFDEQIQQWSFYYLADILENYDVNKLVVRGSPIGELTLLKYPKKRIVKMFFYDLLNGNIMNWDEYSLSKFNHNIFFLKERGYDDRDLFLKKPKSMRELENHISKLLEKEKQGSYLLTQKAVEFLNGSIWGRYKIALPKDSFTLIDVGSKLNICIGNSSYAKKIQRKLSHILFLLINDQVEGCVEIINGHVVQARGVGNVELDFFLDKNSSKKIQESIKNGIF